MEKYEEAEKIGELLKQCYKVWQSIREARNSINHLLEKEEIAEAIREDTRLQIIINGLLNGDDLELIEDAAQVENLKKYLKAIR